MPFEREHVRHPLTVRRLRVSVVERVVPNIVRVTLTGPEFAGFASDGPSDHVKVFFPDPATGVLTLPEVDAQGLRRGDPGIVISRDYTPRAIRPAAGDRDGELDLDIVLHGLDGPASAWGQLAKPGDELGVGGPRGSRLVPAGIEKLIVVADETALPTTARWLELIPTTVHVTGLFAVHDECVEAYFDAADTAELDAEWLTHADGRGALEESLRSLGPIDASTYVFLAGEAELLIPLRRYLRHELGLPAEQVSASGYWRRGITNLDHHAPLDPSDPD
ncbi:MAG TPA: siderophore-interacting protein [Pseudolysinimonas sp.]|jgi:NADPH-dependent ferric siderophore reductase